MNFSWQTKTKKATRLLNVLNRVLKLADSLKIFEDTNRCRYVKNVQNCVAWISEIPNFRYNLTNEEVGVYRKIWTENFMNFSRQTKKKNLSSHNFPAFPIFLVNTNWNVSNFLRHHTHSLLPSFQLRTFQLFFLPTKRFTYRPPHPCLLFNHLTSQNSSQLPRDFLNYRLNYFSSFLQL